MSVNPEVSTDHPEVEVSTLAAQPGGFFALSSHSGLAVKVMVTTTLPVRSLSRVTSEGLQPLRREGAGWRISLEPHEGAVLRWLP
jgi:hypothetical protein